MKKKDKKTLVKKNWIQNFNLVGEAKVTDYTFKIDEHSNKSDWIYNMMNLGIFCGENHGTVFCDLMGGYGSEREDNPIYVHGKKEDNTDDFDNNYTIDWDDRLDDSILEDIGDLCFITVGIEKDSNEKTYYKKFLTPYDAIEYIKEHLTDGMVINVKGQLKYQLYNDSISVKKEINSIAISKAALDSYKASFTQTILLNKDSAGSSNIDKEKNILNVDAYLLEKFKEFNGHDLTNDGKIKGGQFVPLRKRFEYELDLENKDLTAKIISKLFRVKKGITQATFLGDFVESGAAINVTIEDVPDDIKDLIEIGVYTEEEALKACSTNGAKERRMILRKPLIKQVGDDDNKVPQIQRTEQVFDDEDLLLDCLIPKENDEEEEDLDTEDSSTTSTSGDEDEDLAALLDELD
ncbi:hypothetical protein [Clostridium sp.]|uniref:hypothetical protein n=1 Tax=Clostridium sp. TaxID=1506 RepID=UPI0032176B79